MWKRECQRRKTEWCLKVLRRRPGQIEWVLGCFMTLFLAILICAQLQAESYRATSLYLEDALAASNLASAVIDIEEYGISHVVEIEDPVAAYRVFCNAIKGNLQLNEQWESGNRYLLTGHVTVENYTVYNVNGDVVSVYIVNDGGVVNHWQGTLGTIAAPDGVVIENTSIYSEISFPVQGSFGICVTAHKGKLVDIVSEWLLSE